MKLVAAILLIYLFSVGISCSQTIKVVPDRILTDETTAIRVTGLKSAEHVVVRGELVDGDSKTWDSEAEFIADDQGTVDVTKQTPVKGSYRNCSAMGLIWSMRPTTKDVHLYRPPRALEPQKIRFVLVRDGKEISTTELTQMAIADGVSRFIWMGPCMGYCSFLMRQRNVLVFWL